MEASNINYRFNRVGPTRNVSGVGALAGSQVEFNYSIPINYRANLMEAYISIRLKITKNAPWELFGGVPNASAAVAGTTTIDSRDGICQHPFGALFSNAMLSINDVPISENFDYGISSAIMKLCWNTADEEVDSMSPIVPYDYTPAGYLDGISEFKNSKVIVRDGVQISVSDKTRSILERVTKTTRLDSDEVNSGVNDLFVTLCVPLAPLLIQKSFNEAVPSCRLKLVFQPDADHLKKLVICAVADVITLDVQDMYFNVPTYLDTSPANLKWDTRFTEAHTTKKSADGSTIQVGTVSSGTHTIMLAFGVKASTNLTDVHQFEGAFVDDGAGSPLLKTLSINYGSKNYPSLPYNFITYADCHRAYYDYKIFTKSHSMSTGSVLKYKQWLQSPMFVFSVVSEPGERNAQLQVEYTGTGAVVDNTMNLYIVTLHDKQLRLVYDSNAQVETVQTGSIV